MTIIRSRAAVGEASTADLVETYNAMTGKSITKFSSRAAAESQTSNAIMLGEDRAAKLGVKKGAAPVAMTVEEEAAARKARSAGQETAQGAAPAAAPKPTPKGSLREALKAKAGDAAPHKAREKKAREKSEGREPRLESVRRVVNGEPGTSPREDSERGRILHLIGASKRAFTIDELSEALGFDARRGCRNLIRFGHLERAQ